MRRVQSPPSQSLRLKAVLDCLEDVPSFLSITAKLFFAVCKILHYHIRTGFIG